MSVTTDIFRLAAMPENLPHDWEMSPRYRIFDSAAHRVRFAGIIRWQLHLIKQPSWDYAFVWLCPFDVADDAGFVAFDKNHQREYLFSANRTLQTLEPQIFPLASADALARRFVLNTRGQLRMGNQRAREFIIATRDGAATARAGANEQGTPFHWRKLRSPIKSAAWIQMPAAQIWAELQTLLADPDSEANFARQYAYLSPMQRRERIQQTQGGALDELNRLLYDIVLASPQWDDLHEESELFLSLYNSGEVRMWDNGRGNPGELVTSAFVRENVRALWNYFRPFDRAIAKFLCVQSSGENSLCARAFRPSAHQQLEAQLRLRDWMNDHPKKGQCRE